MVQWVTRSAQSPDLNDDLGSFASAKSRVRREGFSTLDEMVGII